MEVIILAGGKGTRLQEIVADVPKPMAPVNDKPFLLYVLDWLLEYKIDRLILSVGYKAEIIKKYFGENYRGIPIIYAHEHESLGTGGAIRYALSVTSTDNILILNGDTFFPINLSGFSEFHKRNDNTISIALKHLKNFDRYGTVDLQNDTIINFNEKEYKEEGLINAGIYLLNKSKMEFQDLPEVFSFEKAILEKASETGLVKGMVFTDDFIDIGIPKDYYKACRLLR